MLVDVRDPSLTPSSGAAPERLARFVELLVLPIVAALEGLDGLDRNRVHVMFKSVRDLAAARSAMSAISNDSVVGLGALSLDTSLDASDAVLVLVDLTAHRVELVVGGDLHLEPLEEDKQLACICVCVHIHIYMHMHFHWDEQVA